VNLVISVILSMKRTSYHPKIFDHLFSIASLALQKILCSQRKKCWNKVRSAAELYHKEVRIILDVATTYLMLRTLKHKYFLNAEPQG